MPTRLPSSVSAAARLLVSVDLPTPPLPEPMHRTFATCASAPAGSEPRPSVFCSLPFSASERTSNATSTFVTPSTEPASRVTASTKWLRIGQPAVVSETVTATAPASEISIERTIPSSTIDLCSSGSLTRSSAARISSLVAMATKCRRPRRALRPARVLASAPWPGPSSASTRARAGELGAVGRPAVASLAPAALGDAVQRAGAMAVLLAPDPGLERPELLGLLDALVVFDDAEGARAAARARRASAASRCSSSTRRGSRRLPRSRTSRARSRGSARRTHRCRARKVGAASAGQEEEPGASVCGGRRSGEGGDALLHASSRPSSRRSCRPGRRSRRARTRARRSWRRARSP